MSSTPVASASITVQVIYASPDKQTVMTLSIPEGYSAQQAVEKSGILAQHPDIPWPHCKLGLFGKIIPNNTPLKEGDRIEIYRPLVIDPKESRRQRALLAKK